MNTETVLCVKKEIRVRERMDILTSVGRLVPSYTYIEDGRKKEAPVCFYSSGALKSLPLEDATEIQTEAGNFRAELVTFYKNGNLKRLFPLNGRISAYWTEADEYGLAETLDIDTPAGNVRVKPIYLQFFETGELESIGFWPGETAEVDTPAGRLQLRKGVTFHRNGTVASCEPAVETEIETPLGNILAFDPDPDGIKAESRTLSFDSRGSLTTIATVSNRISVNRGCECEQVFSPAVISSYCDENSFTVKPLLIGFSETGITFSSAGKFLGCIGSGSTAAAEPFVHKLPAASVCTL